MLGPAEWAVSAGPTILNAPLELRSLNSRRPARDQSDFVASQNGPFQFRGKVQAHSNDSSRFLIQVEMMATPARAKALHKQLIAKRAELEKAAGPASHTPYAP